MLLRVEKEDEENADAAALDDPNKDEEELVVDEDVPKRVELVLDPKKDGPELVTEEDVPNRGELAAEKAKPKDVPNNGELAIGVDEDDEEANKDEAGGVDEAGAEAEPNRDPAEGEAPNRDGVEPDAVEGVPKRGEGEEAGEGAGAGEGEEDAKPNKVGAAVLGFEVAEDDDVLKGKEKAGVEVGFGEERVEGPNDNPVELDPNENGDDEVEDEGFENEKPEED